MFEFFGGGKNNIEPAQEKNESVEIEKESKKLNRINSYIENTNDPDLRKVLIDEADKLNDSLAVLEINSGLSESQIMKVYSKMSKSPEVAKDIITETIKSKPEKFKGVESIGGFIDSIKEVLSPPRLATLVAALAVVTAINSEAGVVEDIIKKNITPNNEGGPSRRVDQESIDVENKLGGVAIVDGKRIFEKKSSQPSRDFNSAAIGLKSNPREQELNDSIGDSEIGLTTKDRVKEGDLRKIKMLFGLNLPANYPASIVMMHTNELPGNLSMTFNKLKKAGDSDKKFIELLEENAGNFMPGELEDIHKYLSDRFENEK